MKKLICVLSLLILPSCRVWAQEVLPEQERWIEQVDGGCVIPASAHVSQNYALGFGGDVLMGYRFSRQFSLSADLGYYDSDQKTLGGNAGEWDYTPLMAVARYNLNLGVIRPYLLLGAGVAFNSYSLTGGSATVSKSTRGETDFLLSPGLGALVVVAADMAVYIQGRLDMDFTPAFAGLPPPDSPSLFIPIKLGMTFFAL
jgi:hypothetical protein